MFACDLMWRFSLLAIFTVSGFVGLFYESIWSHYLKLVLGHAAYAQTLVVGIFMGGLAIGSWLAGKLSVRLNSPLKGYALIEIVLGGLGVAFHYLYLGLSDVLLVKILPAISIGIVADLVKWGGCALLILPQSILLGMTFPFIGAALVRFEKEQTGFILSMLYFSNSIGAAIGVLVCGLYFIPEFGLPTTSVFAGFSNILIGLTAWLVAKKRDGYEFSRSLPEVEKSFVNQEDKSRSRTLLLAAAGTGFASFCYEIGWIRLLVLVLGSSLHAFELMLGAFIFGLALGGLVIRNRVDASDPFLLSGSVQLIMALLAVLSLVCYSGMFDLMAFLYSGLVRNNQGYLLFNGISQSIALLVMLPASVFAGMTLPLFSAALLKIRRSEQAIGDLYAANTLGSIVGIAVATHLLIPILGLKWLIGVGALIDCIVGYILLRKSVFLQERKRELLAFTSVFLVIFICSLVEFDPIRMTSGVFRYGGIAKNDGRKVLFQKAGKTATISVFQIRDIISIATNGKIDGGLSLDDARVSADESTMVLTGAVPVLAHSNPKKVAVIGFGTGLSLDSVLRHQKVKNVSTIEIEPTMVEGARLLGKKVERAFTDPRVELIFDDARSTLLASSKKYDVIISEPSNPWVSGVANLFSQEFYEVVAQSLNQGGVFGQWIQMYEIDDAILNSFVAPLISVFPNIRLFKVGLTDFLFLASQEKLPSSFSNIEIPADMIEPLKRIGFSTGEQIDRVMVADRDILKTWSLGNSTLPHSEFFPKAAYQAVKSRFLGHGAVELVSLLASELPVRDVLDLPSSIFELHPKTENSELLTIANEPLVFWEYLSGDGEEKVDRVSLEARALKALINCSLGQQDNTNATDLRKMLPDLLWHAALRISALPQSVGVESFWEELSRNRCIDVNSVKDELDFFTAISMRNSQEMMRLAEKLILADKSESLDIKNFTIGAFVLGAIKEKDDSALIRGLEYSKNYLSSKNRWPGTKFLLTYAIGRLYGRIMPG